MEKLAYLIGVRCALEKLGARQLTPVAQRIMEALRPAAQEAEAVSQTVARRSPKTMPPPRSGPHTGPSGSTRYTRSLAKQDIPVEDAEFYLSDMIQSAKLPRLKLSTAAIAYSHQR